MTYIDPRNKLFAHLDRLSAIKEGHNPAPVNVEIDLSNRCSLGCEWCHFAYTHTRGPWASRKTKPQDAIPGGDLMDTRLALSIVDQLAGGGVRSITWTGGGEPTLHPDFERIIGYTGQRIEQGIYTNGAHIDEARAKLMKDAMTFVYVSLDAVDAEHYKKDKGVDRFKQVCQGVQNLALADGKATVGLGFLLTKDNWRDAWGMIALGRELGADYVQFRPTIRYDAAMPGDPADDLFWLGEATNCLASIEGTPGVEIDISRFKMYRYWRGHGYDTCWWSSLQTVITPNGKMWTCVNKREFPGEEIGDLSRETFYDVWLRHKTAKVNDRCRLMCRGHIPNLALNEIMREREHEAFI